MKTPREFLLGRRNEDKLRLDEIRRTVLARELQSTRARRVALPRRAWEELILPARRLWMGLAAAWVVILAVELSSGETTQTAVRIAPPDAAELMALKNQRLLLAQLLYGMDEPQPDTPAALKPRTELHVETFLG